MNERRRAQVLDAQDRRRQRALAAGLCTTCCRLPHRPERRTCSRCIEASRKSKAKRFNSPYAPQVRLLPLPLDSKPFDIEADRREEWLSLNELAIRHYLGSFPFVA